MYNVKELVSLFTDHFRKDRESNTHKLMQLFSDELQLLENTNNRIIEWRDIDNAEGKTLDLIGQNVVQPRGTASDEIYRIMLKTKVARNLADGTLNGLISAIAYVLQIDKREVQVSEMWDLVGMPAALAVEAIPLEKIINANLTTDEFEIILSSLVAGGVKLMLLASSSKEYMELSGESYAFLIKHRITSRFRAGAVHGAIVGIEAELLLNPYDFMYNFPITSRFKTASVAGGIAETELSAIDDAYGFEVKRRVTGRFRTGQK